LAAHTTDWLAAAKVGLRTAHIASAHTGLRKRRSQTARAVDVAAADLEDLAVRLGA